MRRLLFAVILSLLVLVAPATVHADVNNFVIKNYTIEYTLQKDSRGRSVLNTVETITAEFPNYDQNHGIERAIPKSYDGHPTDVIITAVRKTDGTSWNYTTYSSNDNLVVRIGDADTFVHGEQTYVISYTQRDVTKYFADTKDDEFYWDTNGTEWRVPIEHLEVTLRLDSGLKSALNGRTACYQGATSSTDTCELTKDNDSFSVSADNLAPEQNVTVAVGFAANTFKPYQQSTFDKVFGYIKIAWIALLLVGVAIIFWIPFKWASVVNRKKEIGTIIPEYLPPKDTSVTAAASLLSTPRSVFAAQLLDFAVRHYVKLYEVEKSGFLGFKRKDYEVEIIRDIGELKAEEQELLRDVFGDNTAVGSRLALSTLKSNTTVYQRTLDNDKKLKQLVRGQYGLRAKDARWTRWFRKLSLGLLLLASITLNPALALAALFAFISSFTVWVLTDKGLELSRYLKGLKMYIGVAEAERLQMLQSPEGAQKAGGVNPEDKAQLVKLYERALPYAVLFGQEKEWNKQIGTLYESTGQNPDWYSGRSAFTAATFGSALSGFSSAAGYSSASSSSSGGSSGGGSSGGGGGGGGGGGW